MIFTLSTCYNTSGDIYVSDLDIVATDYDDSYNFTAPQTFFLPDSVYQVGLEIGDEPSNGAFAELIIAKTRQNLLALGYVEATDP